MTLKLNGTNSEAAPAYAGDDADTGLQCGTNELKLVTGGSAQVTVDSSGRLLAGTTSARTNVYSSALNITPQIQFESNFTNYQGGLSLINNSASGHSPVLTFGQSYTNTLGGNGLTPNNEPLGILNFTANDGSNFRTAATIQAFADGTTGSGDVPGRLAFYTSADGASSPTERMRLDSGGRLGIGATPGDQEQLLVHGGDNSIYVPFARSDTRWLSIHSGGSDPGIFTNTGANLRFGHGSARNNFSTERMRIDSSGNLLHGKTSQNLATAGFQVRSDVVGLTQITTSSASVLDVNRSGNDGTIVNLRQNTNIEGTISVSGSTVSYNGGHLARWSQLAGGTERIEILRGSVLSNLDEMCEWGEEDNEQLNRMKVSDVEGDVNVSGVFQAWDDDDDTYTNDFYCAMTGDFVIRIAQGTTVARGDLLMSAGDGTAKPQDDDIVRSKTIAKVTSTTVSTTYSDGSYCVPCVLMAC